MPIEDIFHLLTDSELKKAVLEIESFHHQGILIDGVVRELARQLEDQYSMPSGVSLNITEKEVLMRAALKYASADKLDN